MPSNDPRINTADHSDPGERPLEHIRVRRQGNNKGTNIRYRIVLPTYMPLSIPPKGRLEALLKI